MRLTAGDLTIDINCRNGLYAFYDDSATGKSYLTKVLKALMVSGSEDICAITYDELLTEEVYVDILMRRQYKVVILDRLDLYITDRIEDCINKIKKNCVVLVALNNWNKFKRICPDLCDVEFDLKGFKVSECAN